VVSPPTIRQKQKLLELRAMSIRVSLLRIALVLWLLGVFCLIAFRLIGSSIDQDGFLNEPFPLIPIGWLFIILGAIVGVIHVVRAGVRYVLGRHS